MRAVKAYPPQQLHNIDMSPDETNAAMSFGKRIPWAKIAVFAAASAVAYVFFIDWCDFIFDCGCRPLWAGAAEHCNINNANPPHCPWCVEGGRYGGAAFGAIVIAQAAPAFWRGPLTLPRILLVFLAFPFAGAVAGWLTGLYAGYWTP